MRRSVRFAVSAALIASAVIPAVQIAAQPAANAVTTGSLGASPASSWQANATVWKMAYANGDIWMVGDFTNLRPPGAAAGTNTQPANYFAALNASTGAPDTNINDTHTFTGQSSGLPLSNGIVAASPDGKTIYVGGAFNAVDGVTRHHIAAFSATTGALLPWNPNVSGQVSAIATSGNTVYVGGTFGNVGNVATGPNLAAIDATTGKKVSWGSGVQPSTDANVDALAVTADGSQVVAGGYFDMVDGLTQSSDGTTRYNKAVIIGGIGSAEAGTLEPMTADNVVPIGTAQHNTGCYSNVKDIVVSGSAAYFANEGTGGGCLDGTWAANLPDGSLKWLNQCLGATQIVEVVGNYLYKGSHAHDCQKKNTNGDPDNFPQVPTGQARHLLSENLSNGFLGPWYPFTDAGPNLGPRAMATDGTQLYVGGDFTQVNHKGQQGIARFTPTSDYATPQPGQPVGVSPSPGTIDVFAQAPVDLDSPDLTMQLYRDGGSTPIATKQVHSLFWNNQVVGFSDTGLTVGSSHTYRVRAIETNGSGSLSILSPVSAPITASNGSTGYPATVLSQSPAAYWRFGETTGTVGADSSPNLAAGIFTGGVSLGAPGAISGDSDTAATFDGTTGYFSSSQSQPSPKTFSIDAWFNTTTTTGGKIIGFGNLQQAGSANYDKQIYMTNAGKVVFGCFNKTDIAITSGKSYNDGKWHQVIGTQGPSGMVLYVDGASVGTNSNTANQNYTGYWRVGQDTLKGWPNAPTSTFFGGKIDDVSVYNSALSASQVAAQFAAANGTSSGPIPPGAPGTLTATANGTSEIDLSWGASNGATSYDVQRGSHGAGTFPTDLGTTTSTTFADTGLNPGDQFDYRVVPSNSTGTGAASNTATGTTLPAQVTGLTANAVSGGEIDLSWNAAAGAVSYTVQRAPHGSSSFTTVSSGSSATTFNDTTVGGGTSYDYRVAAVDAGGTGAYSTVATATTPLVAPGKVTGLTASAPTATEVDLSWTATPGATAYEVDRSTTSGSSGFSQIASGLTSPSYHDLSVSPTTQYWYQVIASNGGGAGPASDSVTVTTPAVNAVLRSNSFEGGSAGAAITAANSGGGSGDKFDAVTCSGGNPTYSSNAAHGSLGASLAVGTTTCFLQWGPGSIASTTTSYGRAYVYLPSNPGASTILAKIGDSSFARDAQINLSTTGKLSMIDATNTRQASFTQSIPLNTWVRVEWSLTNSTTTGSFTVSLFNGDATSPLETHTVSNINTGASFGSLQIGSVIATSTAVGTIGLDDIAYGVSGPLGPVG
jgi:fibronectin type 3 domain-containing protein